MLMNNCNMGQNIAKSDRGPDKKGKLYHICGGFMEKVSSCPTLCDSMDCSLPGSSVHGIFPGKNTEVGCHSLLLGIFLSAFHLPVSVASVTTLITDTSVASLVVQW